MPLTARTDTGRPTDPPQPNPDPPAQAGLSVGPAPRAVAGLVRNPRPPRRTVHRADNPQRLEKRHLPLGHELRLRSALVVLRVEEIGVEHDGVDCRSVGGEECIGSPCL